MSWSLDPNFFYTTFLHFLYLHRIEKRMCLCWIDEFTLGSTWRPSKRVCPCLPLSGGTIGILTIGPECDKAALQALLWKDPCWSRPLLCFLVADLLLLAVPGNARLRVVRRPAAGAGEGNGGERNGRLPDLQPLSDQMGPESCRFGLSPCAPKPTWRWISLHLVVCLFVFTNVVRQADHVTVYVDHEKDVVTGLKQKTHYGRPAWDKEFEIVRKENPT